MAQTLTGIDAEVIESALTALTRHIRGYCVSGADRVSSLLPKYRPAEVERYARMGLRLVSEMESLLTTARKLESLRHMDFAAMERDAAELRALVERVSVRELFIQN